MNNATETPPPISSGRGRAPRKTGWTVGRLKACGPYLRLGRFDRPIGIWLLLFPCWWSQTLAEVERGQPYPSISYLILVPDRRGRHACRRLRL